MTESARGRLPGPLPGPPTYGPEPASLIVGVGASRGAPRDEVVGLIRETLAGAGLSPLSVAELVTVDARAGEPGIVAAAAELGVPLRAYAAEVLARVGVPHPSGAPLAAVGTPSVAEAAALAEGGELLVPKRKSRPEGRAAMVTCAVVRRAPRGHPAVAGAATALLPPVTHLAPSGPDRCVKPAGGRIVVLPYSHPDDDGHSPHPHPHHGGHAHSH